MGKAEEMREVWRARRGSEGFLEEVTFQDALKGVIGVSHKKEWRVEGRKRPLVWRECVGRTGSVRPKI